MVWGRGEILVWPATSSEGKQMEASGKRFSFFSLVAPASSGHGGALEPKTRELGKEGKEGMREKGTG